MEIRQQHASDEQNDCRSRSGKYAAELGRPPGFSLRWLFGLLARQPLILRFCCKSRPLEHSHLFLWSCCRCLFRLSLTLLLQRGRTLHSLRALLVAGGASLGYPDFSALLIFARP